MKDLAFEVGRTHRPAVSPTQPALHAHYILLSWECAATHTVPVDLLDVIFDAIAKLVDWDIARLKKLHKS